MKHINLKNKVFKREDFKIQQVDVLNGGYGLLYKPTGQYVDWDFVARESDPEYAGFSVTKEGWEKLLAKREAII